MFYSNKQVADKLNEIYTAMLERGNRILMLPSFEILLKKLQDRQAISVHYLSSELAEPTVVDKEPQIRAFADNGGLVMRTLDVPNAYTTFNMVIKGFNITPFGDDIWSDDSSISLLNQVNGFKMPQKEITELVRKRFDDMKNNRNESPDKKSEEELFILFLESLNRIKKLN